MLLTNRTQFLYYCLQLHKETSLLLFFILQDVRQLYGSPALFIWIFNKWSKAASLVQFIKTCKKYLINVLIQLEIFNYPYASGNILRFVDIAINEMLKSIAILEFTRYYFLKVKIRYLR